ncbi:hypothetical protein F4677DRAFT_442285 [Hypoxylon crocopeplum]|nr:hypothetical protein F4677DRAFT_442285 [Hypoxylon crocopeplum]
MRFLKLQDDGSLTLTKEYSEDVPSYAVLSHTWGEDDEEAASNGLEHFWVDTCCIDKSNNTELSRAINSMFKWYRGSAKCYVYLSDVPKDAVFRKSRWFTRGWTLQELVAPRSVEFFSGDGQRLGDKSSLEPQLHKITGIELSALRGEDLSNFNFNQRMSWSAGRRTKHEEDMVYSLLGIFNVYLPLIYGEGKDKALMRLSEELEKRSKPSLERTDSIASSIEAGDPGLSSVINVASVAIMQMIPIATNVTNTAIFQMTTAANVAFTVMTPVMFIATNATNTAIMLVISIAINAIDTTTMHKIARGDADECGLTAPVK